VTFFTGGGVGLSQSRGSAFAGNASRSDILGRRYQPFANPFFDQASTYTPPSIKALFGFCRFYFLTHGIINAVITKASEYPVTDIILQHRDTGVVQKWESLLHDGLNYRVHQFEDNLDYYCYGNAFISGSFPMRKKLICQGCRAEHDALHVRPSWRYINHQFWLACPKCGQTDFAKSRDDYYPKHADLGLIRWNPEQVHIFYNEATGRMDYALDLTPDFRSQIMMGRKDLVATTPEIFLEAVKTRRSLVFDRQEVFHMRRPSLSTMNRGWGVPLIMPVLKDAFYVQVMKKAQESVLLTHLVPQIFLFPQPATAGADPFTTVDLANWRDHIRRELARQRMDPSYYGILPFPLGHQVIGEHGKSLLLQPEIQQAVEMIVASLGFPIDLIFGQGTYAGSSVNMRMLENFFLSNVNSHTKLLSWVMRRFGDYLNWPVPQGRFKPFRMADDLQRQAFMAQLNQMGKVSTATLLSYADLKVEDEASLMTAETKILAEALRQQQLLNADVQGEAQLVMAKYQAQAQAAMQAAAVREQLPKRDPFTESQASPASTRSPGMALDAVAAALAQKIKTLPPAQQQKYLDQLQDQSPEMAQLVAEQQGMMADGTPLPQPPALPAQAGGQAGGQQQQAGGVPQVSTTPGGQPGNAVDMRPLPEVLPPRRKT
jgi:hypothetical protein